MEKFTTHTGLVVPLDIANVDTDQIIPKTIFTKKQNVLVLVYIYFTIAATLITVAKNQIQSLY